jgi:hypothetical protein
MRLPLLQPKCIIFLVDMLLMLHTRQQLQDTTLELLLKQSILQLQQLCLLVIQLQPLLQDSMLFQAIPSWVIQLVLLQGMDLESTGTPSTTDSLHTDFL